MCDYCVPVERTARDLGLTLEEVESNVRELIEEGSLERCPETGFPRISEERLTGRPGEN